MSYQSAARLSPKHGKSPRKLSPPHLKNDVQQNVNLVSSDSLSLYEKKCLLVNREIDTQGMGRYQWYIWALCGSGYFLDLFWAQAFSLVLSPLQQELGFTNRQSGTISASFNAGLTAGAFFWGFMSDVVGRRWAFNLTCLFSSVFGLCLGGSNTYSAFLVLTAFVGFGVGGNIPVDSTIFLEFVPQKSRRFLLACLSVFQPLGVVICSAFAFAFIPAYSCSPNFSEKDALQSCRHAAPGVPCCLQAENMGWRYLLFTLGAISLFIFVLRFFIFTFRETPKFLIYKGEDDKAIQTLQHIAKVNQQQCRLTSESFEALRSEHDALQSAPSSRLMLQHTSRGSSKKETTQFCLLSRYKVLFSNFPMTRLTILTWLTYIMDFWGFTVAGILVEFIIQRQIRLTSSFTASGFYLPRILALKNGAASVSLKFTYAAYIYTYAPGILGVLLGACICRIPAVGQKWTMVVSSGLMGASILLLSAVDTVAKNEGLFTLQYFFQSMFNALLYGWTPEAFPAPVRGTACGVASFWGRLFGIISPLIAQHLYGPADDSKEIGDVNNVLYLAGGVSLGCVISIALLPTSLMESPDERC